MQSLSSLKLFRSAGPASMIVVAALFSVSAIQLLAQSSASPAPSAPTEPDQGLQTVASCPIRVDEAYLTADPSALSADAAAAKRTLHATLVDVSGKPIVSYVVHAKIAVRPGGTLTNAPSTANISRRWRGDLEPDTPTKQQWTFDGDRFTLGLRRVWFNKVTFTDGTVWDKSPGASCSFAATGRVVQTKVLP